MTDYENQGLRRYHTVMRKIVLVFVLVASAAALIYDYAVARPSVERAYEQITQHFQDDSPTADHQLTNEEVRTLIGKQPARIFRDGTDHVEVYSWIAGFPLRTHNLYVVFRETEDSTAYLRHSKFGYESRPSLLAPLVESEPTKPTESVDGGPALRLAADREVRIAPSDPADQEEMKPFRDADTNGDGWVTEEEVGAAWEDEFAELDQDDDGRISPAEYAAAADHKAP